MDHIERLKSNYVKPHKTKQWDRYSAAYNATPKLIALLEIVERGLLSIAKNTCCDGCQEAAKVAQSHLAAIASFRKDGV